ncbi:MAG: cytochrome o ubiquinol oxidase subunit IV [Acetobacteraceae bacterium]|nr:cytochrome o ubiquinol oxidase subunit IV [Acetobacteraceae bacterium]
MSASAHGTTSAPPHESAHEAGHGTLRGYVTGFVLSVILTAIPFWLVIGHVLDSAGWTAAIILILGVIQIIVHTFYFLHMNSKSEGGWNMMAMIFTVVLVVITLSGSLWIMYHLETNMMPPSPQEMRQMP